MRCVLPRGNWKLKILPRFWVLSLLVRHRSTSHDLTTISSGLKSKALTLTRNPLRELLRSLICASLVAESTLIAEPSSRFRPPIRANGARGSLTKVLCLI